MRDLLDEPATLEGRAAPHAQDRLGGADPRHPGRGRQLAEGALDGLAVDTTPAHGARPARGSPGPMGSAGWPDGPAHAAWQARRPEGSAHADGPVPPGLLARPGLDLRGRRPASRSLAETVISAQLGDGGWNCHIRNRPSTTHSSFHTTLNILENLRIAHVRGVVDGRHFGRRRIPPSSSCSPIGCIGLIPPARWRITGFRCSPIRGTGTTTSCAEWTTSVSRRP